MGCLCSKQADDGTAPAGRNNARKPSFVAQTLNYEKAVDGGTQLALDAVQGKGQGKSAKQLGLERFEEGILKQDFTEYSLVTDKFDFGKKLGTGAFASIYLVTDNSVTPPQKYACKSVDKIKLNALAKLTNKDLLRELRDEVTNLKHLGVNEYIVTFYKAYEDRCFVHVIQEYCGGGELLTRIIERNHYGEPEAAKIIGHMLKAIAYCHEQRIAHRDVKPENYIFADQRYIENGGKLKLVDFGFSCKILPDQLLTECLGTDSYIAPEVIKKRYNEKCDVWSLGVCLYILFTGIPPSWSCECSGSGIKPPVATAISQGGGPPQGFFNDHAFKKISKQGQEFLAKMLETNWEKRMSADDLLKEEWLAGKFKPVEADLDISVMHNMQNWMHSHKLKKKLLIDLADMLEADEAEMKQVFDSLDVEKTGKVPIEKLREYIKQNTNTTEKHLKRIAQLRDIKDVDVDGDGAISFDELRAASMDSSVLMRKDLLEKVFAKHAPQGYMTKATIQTITEIKDEAKLEGIMIELHGDATHNNRIDYTHFLSWMTSHDSHTQKALGLESKPSVQPSATKGKLKGGLSIDSSAQGGAAYDMLLSPMPGKVNWSQAMGKSQAALVPAPAVAPAYSPAAPALASSAEDTPAYEAPPPSRGGKKKKKGSDDEEEDGRV